MESREYDVAIVGGGIIGLSTAMHLTGRFPGWRVAVLEKEKELATHQTGHNSGVIHSGIYYRPGSHKARFCVAGVQKLLRFCDENEIEYDQCGKVIVATNNAEVGRLQTLHERGIAHSVEAYQDGKLTGGLYGLSMGNLFFGESMFHLVPEASKACLAKLVEIASRREFGFIDCQVYTTHLESLGAREIAREAFLSYLH